MYRLALAHTGRIEREKEDVTVYGILTDGETFHFYQISRDSLVCYMTSLESQFLTPNSGPLPPSNGARPMSATRRLSLCSCGFSSALQGKARRIPAREPQPRTAANTAVMLDRKRSLLTKTC